MRLLGGWLNIFRLPQKTPTRCVYKNNNLKVKHGGILRANCLTGLPFSAILFLQSRKTAELEGRQYE